MKSLSAESCYSTGLHAPTRFDNQLNRVHPQAQPSQQMWIFQHRTVNDGISSSLCSLSYASLDEAVGILRTLGKGALLAKIDLKEAYRIVPVHPQDRPLLSMQWKDSIFIDCSLPCDLLQKYSPQWPTH